jgi:hypothetical protein
MHNYASPRSIVLEKPKQNSVQKTSQVEKKIHLAGWKSINLDMYHWARRMVFTKRII